jgi:hypothetical protein
VPIAVVAQLFVWLILITVPIQGLVAATAALRGPAHHHGAASAAVQTHARHAHTHDSLHVHHTQHAHEGLQRHYHPPGEGAVLVNEDRENNGAPAGQIAPRGEPVSAAFIALMPDSPTLHHPDLHDALPSARLRKLRSYIPRLIERPPRQLSLI